MFPVLWQMLRVTLQLGLCSFSIGLVSLYLHRASLETFNKALKRFLLFVFQLQNCCILNNKRALVKKLFLMQILPVCCPAAKASGLVSRHFGTDYFNCFLI